MANSFFFLLPHDQYNKTMSRRGATPPRTIMLMTRVPLGGRAEMAAAVRAGAGLMCGGIEPVGTVFELLCCFESVALIDPDFDVLARIKRYRAHLVIGSIVALAAVGKSAGWRGQSADMVIDGMGAAAAKIVFRPGAGPVILGSYETGTGGRIAVTGITGASGNNFQRTVDMQSLINKDIGIAVS